VLQYEYGVYNLDTRRIGIMCFCRSLRNKQGKWNGKAQFMLPITENAEGEPTDVVTMAAYGAPYEVAADFNMYSLSISEMFRRMGTCYKFAVL
jgi:hypothetical protein